MVKLLFCLLASTGLAQKYEYKVKYSLVQAGTAELIQSINDGVLSSQLSIWSSPWLSNLWEMADSIRSDYIIESGQLINHTKAIHEGGYHRRYDVFFLENDQVQINDKIKEVAWQDMLDVPSLLYVLSRTKFNEGDTLVYKLWDGRGYGDLELLVERQGGRSLRKPFGEEKAWQLNPLSSTEKSRANEIKLNIQLSLGFPHVPERIEIDTKYGAVQMKLVDP